MQRQTMRVDFDLKTQVKAPFRYKQGEVDQNGIEFELVNVDLVGLSGAVYALTPSESKLEPQSLVITGNKAVYIPPTNEAGDYKLELVMYNTNGKTKSADVVMTVIESISASIADYETLYEQVTRKEAEFTTNENTRKTNENTRIANENTRISNEDKRQASITDIEKRFASLSTAQQQQAEVADARMDAAGTVHANLKTRLDEDFKELASKIPTDVAMNGYESVTTNDTLSGEVSSAVLSGNTMVNLAKKDTRTTIPQYNTTCYAIQDLKHSTVYTFITYNKSSSTIRFYPSENKFITDGYYNVEPNGFHIIKRTTKDSGTPVIASGGHLLKNGNSVAVSTNDFDVLLLEGDHTNKPLEFFEGLKSAEVAEINTHGVNLFDGEWIDNSYLSLTQDSSFGTLVTTSGHKVAKNFIPVTVGKTYKFASHAAAIFGYDNNFKTISNLGNNYTDTVIPQGVKYIRFYTADTNTINHKGIAEKVFVGLLPLPYQSSKVTLPSPIKLRSLPNGVADTYDVDTGVLTRRCGEVVLNGSESWQISPSFGGVETIGFYTSNFQNCKVNAQVNVLSDKFVGKLIYSGQNNTECVYIGSNPFLVTNKSKLPTPDVAGFKAWLAQNPTTVVYQLAEPTTEYIENNGQLRSYDSQTTVFANSIVPVKIGGNIPVNYASTLATTMQSLDELTRENRELRNTIDELSNNVNQIHAFMYRMMSAGTLEEPEID